MAISLKLSDEVEARLDRLAALTGKSRAFYATEAICKHLEDLEDLYLAEQRRAGIRAGRVETLSLDDVIRRYGLES